MKKGFTILKNDSISFIPKRLYYYSCTIPKTYSNHLTIELSLYPEVIRPFINFTYSEKIGLCDNINITLDRL